ncbi:hypothetical protein KSS87_000264, partial [Heliosperma pusillum]
MAVRRPPTPATARFLTSPTNSGEKSPETVAKAKPEEMSLEEVKKLMRLVDVEALKRKLAGEGKEVIGYGELLKACEGVGVARSVDEAAKLAKVLDEAGVVMLFRDKVYLHPHKLSVHANATVTAKSYPNASRDPTNRKVGLFFRLTFWEFSWDVMEPIAFFTTASGLVIGYAYFMFTSKDPSYQDLMKTIFLSRQRKLFKKYSFDISRFKELRDRCKCPLDKKHLNENS